MANDINKDDPHYKGEYGSIYEVNRKFPTGGVAGDFVVIDGWAHYWNADRGTWCVNAERDSYWDELITNIIEKFKLVRGATYMGVASLDTVPAKAIGAKMYYFATVAGTYKNFDNLVVPQGINVLLSENGSSWVNTTLLEVAQELGVSTNKVMSQKVVSDKLSDLSLCVDASIENALSGTLNNITIDGNTLTIGKAGFSLFSLGIRTAFEGTEDLIFTSDAGTVRKSLYLNPKYISSGELVNFTEHSDVFVEVIDGTYNGILFAEWYLGIIVNAGLVSSILNKTKIDKANAEIDKIKNEDINTDIENVFSNSDFNALFFSDIHGSVKNLSRILKSAKSYKDRLNCILNGGDTVQYFNPAGLEWYNEQVQDFSIPVITAAGNHDAWTKDWTFDTNENIYSLITSKVKENVPSIVQPDNSSGIFANYYYYDTDKVRVIVLLSMMYQNNQPYFDDNQKNWLISVLADAKTNNKAIIIMNHCPLNPSDAEEIECSWTSKQTWKTGYMHMNDTIPECVDNFIKEGGTFICYLCGHTHRDFVLQSIRYPNQVCFVTMSARYEYVEDGWRSQNENNDDFDSYNYIGVDLKNSVIKIKRIGTNINAWMQRRNTLCWDFKKHKLISVN